MYGYWEAPWKGENLSFLVLLIRPPMLLVPQMSCSGSHLRVNRGAVGEAGAVQVDEKLALQSQRIPAHVPSTNAASRSIWVSSLEKVHIGCSVKKMSTYLQIMLMSKEAQLLVFSHSWPSLDFLANLAWYSRWSSFKVLRLLWMEIQTLSSRP